MKRALIAALVSGAVLVPATAAAANGQWVQCPAIGVASRVDPLLKDGRLKCFYMHSSRSEILTTRTVAASDGKPFRSCLRSNARYGRRNGFYATSAYCSTTLSQDALNKTAYEWLPWNGSYKKYKPVKLGSTNKSGGQFTICRVNDGGYKLGRMKGPLCEYYARKRVRYTSNFRQLLLVQSYGMPTTSPRNRQSTIWLDERSRAPAELAPKLCTTRISPSAFDFNGIIGSLPGARVGPICQSHSNGASFFDRSNPGGRFAGLE